MLESGRTNTGKMLALSNHSDATDEESAFTFDSHPTKSGIDNCPIHHIYFED